MLYSNHQKKGGENMEEEMTDYQFRTLLKMVLEIVNASADKEEAARKIERLIADRSTKN